MNVHAQGIAAFHQGRFARLSSCFAKADLHPQARIVVGQRDRAAVPFDFLTNGLSLFMDGRLFTAAN